MNKFTAFIALSISTGLFSGFLGRGGSGGGLFGSILALLIQVVLIYFNVEWTTDVYLALIALALGLIVVRPTEVYLLKRSGKRRRHTGEYVDCDFNETNIDEIVGQLIAGVGAFIIQTNFSGKLIVLLVSFVAFRYFDVKKPFGIKRVENSLKKFHSASIMLDDVLGGLYAMIVGCLIAGIIKIFS